MTRPLTGNDVVRSSVRPFLYRQSLSQRGAQPSRDCKCSIYTYCNRARNVRGATSAGFTRRISLYSLHCAQRTVQDGFPNGRPASCKVYYTREDSPSGLFVPNEGRLPRKDSPTMQSAAFPWESRRRTIRLSILSSRNAKNDLELGQPPKKAAFYRQIRRHPGEGLGANTISVRSEPSGL
jgi:hypothetical protein